MKENDKGKSTCLKADISIPSLLNMNDDNRNQQTKPIISQPVWTPKSSPQPTRKVYKPVRFNPPMPFNKREKTISDICNGYFKDDDIQKEYHLNITKPNVDKTDIDSKTEDETSNCLRSEEILEENQQHEWYKKIHHVIHKQKYNEYRQHTLRGYQSDPESTHTDFKTIKFAAKTPERLSSNSINNLCNNNHNKKTISVKNHGIDHKRNFRVNKGKSSFENLSSDPKMVLHKKGISQSSPMNSMEQKKAYKVVQAGGEPPLFGFRKPAPDIQQGTKVSSFILLYKKNNKSPIKENIWIKKKYRENFKCNNTRRRLNKLNRYQYNSIAFGRSISKERAFAEEKKRLENCLCLKQPIFQASTNILRNPSLKSIQDIKKAVQDDATVSIQLNRNREMESCRKYAEKHRFLCNPNTNHIEQKPFNISDRHFISYKKHSNLNTKLIKSQQLSVLPFESHKIQTSENINNKLEQNRLDSKKYFISTFQTKTNSSKDDIHNNNLLTKINTKHYQYIRSMDSHLLKQKIKIPVYVNHKSESLNNKENLVNGFKLYSSSGIIGNENGKLNTKETLHISKIPQANISLRQNIKKSKKNEQGKILINGTFKHSDHISVSKKFEDLNKFYRTLEWIGLLEKATCESKVQGLVKNIEDNDNFHEQILNELNYWTNKLKTEQKTNNFSFQSKDLNDIKWRKETDYGLKIKEKSIQDLRNVFEKVLLGPNNKHSSNNKKIVSAKNKNVLSSLESKRSKQLNQNLIKHQENMEDFIITVDSISKDSAKYLTVRSNSSLTPSKLNVLIFEKPDIPLKKCLTCITNKTLELPVETKINSNGSYNKKNISQLIKYFENYKYNYQPKRNYWANELFINEKRNITANSEIISKKNIEQYQQCKEFSLSAATLPELFGEKKHFNISNTLRTRSLSPLHFGSIFLKQVHTGVVENIREKFEKQSNIKNHNFSKLWKIRKSKSDTHLNLLNDISFISNESDKSMKQKYNTLHKCLKNQKYHLTPIDSMSISVTPKRFYDSNVNIHFKTPVSQQLKLSLMEQELTSKQQKEYAQKLYNEERHRKYLQELQDMNSRRHSDNFIPSQKSPIPLNRYDNLTTELISKKPKCKLQMKVEAIALYDFQSESSRELSFKKGDSVYITRIIDKNWYEGEFNNKIGIFPVNYVEPIRTYESYSSKQQWKLLGGQAKAKYCFTAQSNKELELNKGDLITLIRQIDENWFEGKIANRRGIFPISYVEVLVDIQPNDSSDKNSFETTVNECNSIPNEVPVIKRTDEKIVKRTKENIGKDCLNVDTTSKPLICQALYKYRPQNSDELDLLEGDIVHILEKCDDGWYVGTSQRTGYFGTFPGNYVKMI